MQKTTLSLATSVTVIVLSATLVRTQQPDTSGGNDTPGTEGCVFTANCKFTEGLCPGWTNVEGSDNLDWVNNTECQHINGRQCFSVQFKNKPPNSTAMLHSPLLCANGENSSSLSFHYAIAGPAGAMNCPLSVLLMTNTNTSLLRTLHGPRALFFQQVTVDILVSSCPFRVVFEGRKIGGEKCGITHDEINIADVVFKGVVPVTLPTCTSTTSSSRSLGAGAIAGICVGVVIVVALVIAVIIFFQRRRKAQDKADSSWVAEKETKQKTDFHTTANQGKQGEQRVDDGEVAANRSQQARASNSVYEIPESPPIYSTPDDATSQALPASSQVYSKPHQIGPGGITLKPQAESKIPTTPKHTAGEDQYNTLSLENPRAARADHTPLGRHDYDHLDGAVHGLEKGARPSDQSGKPNPGYVNVDAATPADTSQPGQDVYNTLDKEHRPRPAVANADVAESAVVYSHLNEHVAFVNTPTTYR